ncbi:MAG: hypothetical protein HY906_10690 [Deltaproteobacteria bacterium]|nr:hypothetical protein [Deltaproteobacteria bacterium]
MGRRSRLGVVGTLLVTGLCAAFPARAEALDTTQHQLITINSCAAAGLPESFCRRTGLASHDADAEEWYDLTAHAQSAASVDLCGSANAVVARLSALGQQFFDYLALAEQSLSAPTGSDAATASVGMAMALGRALHTIQDNCAHRGMSNPEHAWLSRSDTCHGTDLEPDEAAGAGECAQQRTETLLAEVAPVITAAGVTTMLDQMSCAGVSWDDPCGDGTEAGVWDLCAFLAEAETWDGVDRQWDVAVVAAELDAAFVYGIAADLCTVATLAAPPAALIDVGAGPPTCTDYHIMCLGDGSSPNGWACFGCAGARPREGAASAAALLGLLALVAARRRRS